MMPIYLDILLGKNKKNNRVRYLLLALSMFFITSNVYAATIDYELKIDDSVFFERVIYKIENFENIENGYNFQDRVYNDVPIFSERFGTNDIFYTKNIIQNGNDYVITFSHEFTANEFSKSYFLNSCFDNYVFVLEKDFYYFNYNDNFYCELNDNSSITIITDNEVLFTNSKEETNNRHTWKTSGDKVDMNIKINAIKNSVSHTERDSKETIIILLLAISFISLAFVYVMFKIKRNNDI